MVGPDVINQVRAALERDPDINLHHNPIEISQHGQLCLKGQVDSIVAKRKALRIARSVAGSADVQDRLWVQTSRERDGDGLRRAVLSALFEDGAFKGFEILDRDEAPSQEAENWIRVEAAQGSSEVTLEGRVYSLSHRRLAEVLAWWTPGTVDVDNRIRVEPAEQDSDAEINDAVRLVLEKDPSFDAEQIHIRTEGAVVTLEGAVSSEINRKLASLDCWYVPGVHDVRNQLEVREHLRPS